MHKENFFLIHHKVKHVVDRYVPVLDIVKGDFLVCRVIIYVGDEGQLALFLHKYGIRP
jgi:hypothetical protein